MASPKLPFPWPENAEVETYTGGCHCKKVRYEFKHPDIYTMPIGNCNCSICEKDGYLNVYTFNPDFRFTKGGEELNTYVFDDN
ncbi:hypothetical protein DFH09DRAFT_543167 [Mycena vulgaris]|nr:hypothetical protein DFH09DRAFT_543167 [Mycena vulgaris]